MSFLMSSLAGYLLLSAGNIRCQLEVVVETNHSCEILGSHVGVDVDSDLLDFDYPDDEEHTPLQNNGNHLHDRNRLIHGAD
jgi:hypothetical protein